MNYMIVYEFGGQKLLLCTETSKKTGGINVAMFEGDTILREFFSEFIELFSKREDKSGYAQATVSMATLRPVAIPAFEEVLDLERFLVDKTVRILKGSPLLRRFVGTAVSSEVIGDTKLDIWTYCLDQAKTP